MTRILVVDDVVDSAKLLTCILKRHGYEVLVAHGGRQALELASTESPDAILLDIMMPGMDGIEVCRRLKADDRLRKIPVILVTAKDLDDDVVTGLEAGADDYVAKPFNRQVLLARVRAAIRIKESYDALIESNARLLREVQERKQAEESLRLKDEELCRSQKLEAVGQLASGVAHEFNNLLQAIIGYSCSAMMDLCPRDEGYDDIEQVLKAANQAAVLTRQLLNLSHRQSPGRKNVDPNRMVSNLASLVHPVIGHHIDLTLDLGTDVGTVYADPGGIEQVLLNLCLNSRDAMPRGGKLTIKTQRVSSNEGNQRPYSQTPVRGSVAITVSDTGCGMTPDVQKHVFEPFFTTKEAGKGTGLGLATAYGIVKQNGGTIEFFSRPGEGTSVNVSLPIVDAEPDASTSVADLPVSGGTELILLAEDEPLVRAFTVRTLEKAGYRVLAAADGEEALRVYEENRTAISLILLDLVMPKLMGSEVCRHIRSDNPQAKVILCTGYDREAAQCSFDEQRIPHVIEKPFDSATLLRTVREMLDNGGHASNSTPQDVVAIV